MKRLVWIILGTFFVQSLCAQITFQKLIGGDAFTAGEDVIQTLDFHYIATGQAPGFGLQGNPNLYLVKTDTLGDTIWTRSFGGVNDDFGYGVVETNDGGYVACGATQIFNGTSWEFDAYLVKTNVAGDSMWTRHYGGSQKDIAFDVAQTFDDGFILVGVTESFGTGAGEALLIRTDPVGDTLWMRSYRQGYSNRCFSVEQTPDGGFIVCGRSLSSGSGTDADIYMLRTNSQGDSLWSKTFGGTSFEEGNSVLITPDQGFLSVGYTQNLSGDKDVYLVKTDAVGSLLWSKTLSSPHPEEAYSATNAPGGGFLVTGTRVVAPSWYPDLYVTKLDSAGTMIWERIYGGSFIDAGKSIIPTADGGMIIAGFSNSFDVSLLKLFLLKADGDGLVSNDPFIFTGPINLYPNPLTDVSVLEVPGEVARAKPWLEIYNLEGRIVREPQRIKRKSTHIGPGTLPTGMYFYRLIADETVFKMGRLYIP